MGRSQLIIHSFIFFVNHYYYSLGTITMYNELPNLLAGITYYIIYIINIIFFVLSISETVLLAYIFHSSSQMTTMLVVGQV